MKTFEPNKNAEELGIDLTKKFVVIINGDEYFDKGDILVISEDDETELPYFKRLSDGKEHCMYWSDLYYAERTLRDMEVGENIINGGDEFTVLAICGDVICFDDFGNIRWEKLETLNKLGWKPKDKSTTDTKAEECIAYLEKVGRITNGKIVK
jgi:hypothetical protein